MLLLACLRAFASYALCRHALSTAVGCTVTLPAEWWWWGPLRVLMCNMQHEPGTCAFDGMVGLPKEPPLADIGSTACHPL